MPRIALLAWLVYVALAFGYRSYVQYRRTRHTGFVGFASTKSMSEKLAGMLFVSALALGLLAPLAGLLEPKLWLTHALSAAPSLQIASLVFYIAGLLLTLSAQLAMGDSWRIGVAASERTALVTGGPFRVVRNPIFSAMLLTGVGLCGLYASPLALLGYACLLLGLELQVRVVEEPYLQQVHGDAYSAYVRRTGRFVPWLGRSRAA
jgi:protein-S-isoprenylcysteine O-methyltransferase Ste14